MNIDHSVYPDIEHGEDFEDDGDRADYVMRVCAAWDFGVPPERATVALFREWRSIFDRFPLPHSPSYHAFRATYRWPMLPIPESPLLTRWEKIDAREEREDCMRDRA